MLNISVMSNMIEARIQGEMHITPTICALQKKSLEYIVFLRHKLYYYSILYAWSVNNELSNCS